MFDLRCLDCPTRVSFPERPGEAVCPGCGLSLYLTEAGQLGRYVGDDWRPGGIQGHPQTTDRRDCDKPADVRSTE